MTYVDSPAPVAPAEAPPAVEVTGVEKVFGAGRGEVTALSGVDLTVGAGEFVSLIGPSGCGKSTLLRLIADLTSPTAGAVAVNGKPAAQARADQDYGIAFQQAGLMDWRTVARNVELPLELHGWKRGERRARSTELLRLVGLADVADRRPAELSGGMQQRVAIARALAVRPKLLLMDEPFGALDEMTRERLQDELLGICAETGATAVFVTHSIPEAVYLSDRVVVMSARPGRVTEVVNINLPGRRPRPTGAVAMEAVASAAVSNPDDTRESPEFFTKVTEVREALRAGEYR